MTASVHDNKWYCVDCSHVLGKVVGGELVGSEDISASHFETQGPNVKVTCPSCSRVKIWYTSDTITRAMYQLVNALSSEMAKKMLRDVSKAQKS